MAALAHHKVVELGVNGVVDPLLTPAMGLAARHRRQNEITEADFDFVLGTTNHIIEQIRAKDGSPPLAEAMFDGAGSIATQDNGLRRWSDAR